MIDAHADDRQAKRDIHTAGTLHLTRFLIPIERTHLQGDMSLIMIHRHNTIKLSAFGFGKDTVWRHRTVNVESALLQFLYGRNDFLCFLPAEHSVLTTVRVQTGHPDMRFFNTKLTTGIVNEFYTLDDTCFLHQIASLPQRNVRRNMDDADVLIGKHHRIFLRMGEGSIDFRMPVVVMTG